MTEPKQLELDLGDHVQHARWFIEHDAETYSSFYIKPNSLTKQLYFAKRVFYYEVDWTFYFKVTEQEAEDIIRELGVHDGRWK